MFLGKRDESSENCTTVSLINMENYKLRVFTISIVLPSELTFFHCKSLASCGFQFSRLYFAKKIISLWPFSLSLARWKFGKDSGGEKETEEDREESLIRTYTHTLVLVSFDSSLSSFFAIIRAPNLVPLFPPLFSLYHRLRSFDSLLRPAEWRVLRHCRVCIASLFQARVPRLLFPRTSLHLALLLSSLFLSTFLSLSYTREFPYGRLCFTLYNSLSISVSVLNTQVANTVVSIFLFAFLSVWYARACNTLVSTFPSASRTHTHMHTRVQYSRVYFSLFYLSLFYARKFPYGRPCRAHLRNCPLPFSCFTFLSLSFRSSILSGAHPLSLPPSLSLSLSRPRTQTRPVLLH